MLNKERGMSTLAERVKEWEADLLEQGRASSAASNRA